MLVAEIVYGLFLYKLFLSSNGTFAGYILYC